MNAATLSVIISICALASTILCPVLSTIINNRYQMKIRKQDFYDRHRAEVIENYIHSAGAVIMCHSEDADSVTAYGHYCKEIYLYLPETSWELVDSIEKNISEHKHDTASTLLTELCQKLNKHPPRLKKHRCNHNMD